MWKAVFLVLAAVCAVGLAGLVGAPMDIEPDDEGARNALSFAVEKHNRESNDMYRNDVLEVVSAQKQLVAGLKYVITAKLFKTTCRKESMETDCPFQQTPEMSKPLQCTFTVLSKPWQNFLQVLKTDCN